MNLEEMLQELGKKVVAVATHISEAMNLAADCALDIANLDLALPHRAVA
jgi:hypothetical protein